MLSSQVGGQGIKRNATLGDDECTVDGKGISSFWILTEKDEYEEVEQITLAVR